jgi:tetratricopeptide (TPR) repeat protein
MRAYERGDYPAMINFLEQTLRTEDASADLEFYLGEAYRLLGDYDRAQEKYEDAIAIDSQFAPGYLSRGLLKQSVNPRYDILAELDKAIEYDPQYVEAYLQRASYYADNKDYELALADLDLAKDLMPSNPNIYLEYAEVYLATGEDELAEQYALQGHQLDLTLLRGYLIYARALLTSDQPEEALDLLEVYGRYRPDDPLYWALTGAVLYETGDDYKKAYEMLERAISIDDNSATALYYHGLTALELGDSNQAVNDFYLARSMEPESFDINIWFGIALYHEARYEDAFRQIGASELFIRSDEDRVIYHYYRGKSGLEISQFSEVEENWRALQALPNRLVPVEWMKEIIAFFATPTFTPPPSQTQTPKPSSTVTRTPVATQTRTPTAPTSTSNP